MPTLEVEVKLKVKDPAGVPALLAGVGARLLHPREFEDNRLYDFPDRALMNRGAMLRVRAIGRGTLLTYKDKARTEQGVKVREEIEARLAAAEAGGLSEILERVGMGVIFQYQKYRTTWEAGGLLLTLDETPIGCFLELEGDRRAIDAMAARLGYGPLDYIPQSYRDLYMSYRSGASGPADRMIFPDRAADHG